MNSERPILGVTDPSAIERAFASVDSPAYDAGKRALDIMLAFLALVVIAMITPFVALAIWLDDQGPVFYRTERLARGGRWFVVWKYRTMRRDADQILDQVRHLNEMNGPAFKASKDPRVTRVGRFLRVWSIDELPQFWNALRGDMSLVGPRPVHTRDFEGYEGELTARSVVKPGITGLWQVSGRSRLGLDEMIRLDLEYVSRRGFLLDLAIIVRTIPALLTRRGAM